MKHQIVDKLTPDTMTNSYFGCPNIYGKFTHNGEDYTIQDKMNENPGISIEYPKEIKGCIISNYYAVYNSVGKFNPDYIGIEVHDKIYICPTI